jgi:hypothetical protein
MGLPKCFGRATRLSARAIDAASLSSRSSTRFRSNVALRQGLKSKRHYAARKNVQTPATNSLVPGVCLFPSRSQMGLDSLPAGLSFCRLLCSLVDQTLCRVRRSSASQSLWPRSFNGTGRQLAGVISFLTFRTYQGWSHQAGRFQYVSLSSPAADRRAVVCVPNRRDNFARSLEISEPTTL